MRIIALVAEYLSKFVVLTYLTAVVALFVWGVLVARPQIELERAEEERQRAERHSARKLEMDRRMAAFGAYEAEVVGAHAADVEEWCLWVVNEPGLDRPIEEWYEWLRRALPIYLLAGEPPDACWRGDYGW